MTPKAKYYETLANTMIKNFEKRRMEAYYYPTAKEAVEKALLSCHPVQSWLTAAP